MRIESITVRNLGPFAERHVDLTALPTEAKLVAVTGHNGAGKSTLLELATGGALYRECATRGSLASLATARDASLEVKLVNGQPWTIRHTVDAVSGKGVSIATDVSGSPTTSTGGVRDFDAWAKSALPSPEVLYASTVAVQGSGGFLELKPGDRKAALLRLLGVERLEGLAHGARERARDTKAQLATIQARLADARSMGGDIASLEASLRAARDNAEAAEAALVTARAELEAASATAAAQTQALTAYAGAVETRSKLENQLADTQLALYNLEGRDAEQRALLADADAVRVAVADVARLTPELAAVDAELADRKAKRVDLANRFEAATRERSALSTQLSVAKERVAHLQKLVAQGPAVEAAVAELPELRAAQDTIRTQLTGARRDLEEMQGQRIAGAEERIDSLREALDTIRRDVPYGMTGEAAGYIAADALRVDNREIERSEELPRQIECLSGEVAMFESSIERNAAALATAETTASKLGRLELDRAALVTAEETTWQLTKQLETVGTSIPELVAAIDANDTARHAPANRRVDVAEALHAAKELAAKATELAQAEARLLELEPQLTAAKARESELLAAVLTTPEPVRPPPAPDVAPIKAEACRLEASVRSAQAAVARHEAALESARASAVRIAELEMEATAVETELGDWNRLAADLGRDGLQAALIDAAGPELTALTNDLLRSCVGTRWTVSFETTRLSADGRRTLEGLDVRVIDSERGRDTTAETLSGGERVLLGESVSLALSALACRRAGIERPTLVRDESGAALDAERGEAYVAMLRRAIDLIGADRCLLVSHSPAVQELCDARVEL